MHLPRTQLPLLGKEIFEEHDDWRYHLFKGVLVDNFVHQAILVTRRNNTCIHSMAVVYELGEDLANSPLSLFRLVTEDAIQRIVGSFG